MNKQIFISLLPAMMLMGCKKNYTCSCGINQDRTPVFEIRDTKKKAEQKCLDYQKQNYAIPEYYCSIK